MDREESRQSHSEPAEATSNLVPFTTAKDRCVEQFERAYLERLLQESQGNVSLAARLARMDRKYLRILLKRYELWIPRRSFRAKNAVEPTEA